MKNPPIRLALALLSLCALTACGNTIRGAGKDVGDISDWTHNRPSTFGNAVGQAPTGYYPKSALPDVSSENIESSAPAPAPVASAPSSFNDRNLVWHQVNHYNADSPALPEGDAGQPAVSLPPAPPAVVQYNRSVDVYPVNGDEAPYNQISALVSNAPLNGEIAEQIFFANGSAKVSRADHKDLRELAQSLVHQGGEYRLDIVGHASKRVKHTKDPIRKKMINFKMAQKRANAVAEVLLKSGAAPDWIVTTSLGDAQANPHRQGKSQEAADRRAEIFLNSN